MHGGAPDERNRIAMKAYKGFNQDLTCRDFQFAEGGEYEEERAIPCETGFHACVLPLDVLSYYPPASSVYHEVEVDDDAATHHRDSKVASKRIKIGAKVTIAGLVKAQFDAIWSKATIKPGASATGESGAASATGESGAASATGWSGAASATGWSGAASATGERGAASATGKDSVALSSGWHGRAKGAKGCALFLAERDDNDHIVAVKAVIVGHKSGGRRIKADAWYSLRGGKAVEVDDAGEVIA